VRVVVDVCLVLVLQIHVLVRRVRVCQRWVIVRVLVHRHQVFHVSRVTVPGVVRHV
jgi:hypothetical protein